MLRKERMPLPRNGQRPEGGQTQGGACDVVPALGGWSPVIKASGSGSVLPVPLWRLWLFPSVTSLYSEKFLSTLPAIPGMLRDPGVEQIWVCTWAGALKRVHRQNLKGAARTREKTQKEGRGNSGGKEGRCCFSPYVPTRQVLSGAPPSE